MVLFGLIIIVCVLLWILSLKYSEIIGKRVSKILNEVINIFK